MQTDEGKVGSAILDSIGHPISAPSVPLPPVHANIFSYPGGSYGFLLGRALTFRC